MNEDSQAKTPHALTPKQQRLLLGTVVGSLVLYAALAPQALAQQGGQPVFRPDAPAGSQPLPRVYAQPFRDLLAKMQRLTAAGELSAADSFEFTVEARRNEDGTLGDVRFTKAEAKNARWRQLTEEFVTLLSDSRALSYLEEVGRLTLTLKLDERAAVALAADAATDARAAQLGKTSSLLFDLARHSQRGREGGEVWNNMTVSASGKRLLMKLEMSRAEVGNLLSTNLALP